MKKVDSGDRTKSKDQPAQPWRPIGQTVSAYLAFPKRIAAPNVVLTAPLAATHRFSPLTKLALNFLHLEREDTATYGTTREHAQMILSDTTSSVQPIAQQEVEV